MLLQFVIRVYHSLVYVEEYISIGIRISLVKMKFVLGWGVPLLCMGFGGFIALTFAGNTCLMIVCICFDLTF